MCIKRGVDLQIGALPRLREAPSFTVDQEQKALRSDLVSCISRRSDPNSTILRNQTTGALRRRAGRPQQEEVLLSCQGAAALPGPLTSSPFAPQSLFS